MSTLRGLISFLALSANLILSGTFIFVFGLLSFLTPKPLSNGFSKIALWLSDGCVFLNKHITMIGTHGQWHVTTSGQSTLDPKGWYLLISNHLSWADVLVLWSVFSGKIPLQKFFMKRQLIWQLPIAGLACYFLNFPFIARYSRATIKKKPQLKGKDLKTTQAACQQLKITPSTLACFVEGTRFTLAKKEKQHSPHQHLLKPKAAGIAISLREMADKLNGIVNVTIHYQDGAPSLWDFLCGRAGRINVHYECLNIDPTLIGDYHNNRAFRRHFQGWLNALWEKKDHAIQQLTSKQSPK